MTAIERAELLPRRLPALFRAFLRWYPAAFRKEFGAELHEVILHVRDDARDQPRIARIQLDVSLAADIVRGAVGERIASLLPARSRGNGIRRTGPERPHRVDSVLIDLRSALGAMLLHRAFAAMVVLTLGVGIGGVTAMWSVVHGVLLRPLPYPNADRLLRVSMDLSDRKPFPTKRFAIAGKQFVPWSDSATTLESIGAFYQSLGRTIEGGSDPIRVPTGLVSARFFDVVGGRPVLGRGFARGEDRVGAPPVTVLSYELWQSQFAGASNVVGKTIRVNGVPTTIIGVAPRGLRWLERPEFWSDETPALYVPFAMDQNDQRGYFQVLALPKPGITATQVARELGALAGPFGPNETPASQRPDVSTRVTVESLHEALYGTVRDRVLVPLVAVVLVLVLACINVANLFASRLPARRGEMATRMAMGATRARLVQQLLIETLALSLAAVLLGIVIARWTTHAVAVLGPQEIPRLSDVRVDGTALMMSAGLGVVSALICGIVPALTGSRVDLARDLSGVRHRSYGFGRGYGRVVLVGAQFALALLLLSSASVLLRSFVRLSSVDTGLPKSDLVAMQLALPGNQYQEDLGPLKWGGRIVAFRPEWYRFIEEMVSRVQRDRRVLGATGSVHAAFQGSAQGSGLLPEGADSSRLPRGDDARYRVNAVTPDYFRTLGITLVAGRLLAAGDGPDSPPVAVINQTLARRYWPGLNPVGRRFYDTRAVRVGDSLRFDRTAREVVGVVRDVREQDYKESPRGMWYKPLREHVGQPAPSSSMRGLQFYLTIRGREGSRTIEEIVRRTAHDLNERIPVYNVTTAQDLVDRYVLRTPRFFALLLSLFGGFAIVLAAAGVFGVLAMAVSHRTHEIGVRMALGASEWSVVRLVLRQVLAAASAGAIAGLVLSVGAGRFIRGFLFNTAPTDLGAMTAAAIVLLLAGAAAAWVPARRATHVNPVLALRSD